MVKVEDMYMVGHIDETSRTEFTLRVMKRVQTKTFSGATLHFRYHEGFRWTRTFVNKNNKQIYLASPKVLPDRLNTFKFLSQMSQKGLSQMPEKGLSQMSQKGLSQMSQMSLGHVFSHYLFKKDI